MTKERQYRFVSTMYPEDYEKVRTILASVGMRVIANYGKGIHTVLAPEGMITASAFIMQGLLDNFFIRELGYRDTYLVHVAYTPMHRQERASATRA